MHFPLGVAGTVVASAQQTHIAPLHPSAERRRACVDVVRCSCPAVFQGQMFCALLYFS